MESGVATRPIADLRRIEQSLRLRLPFRPHHEAAVHRRQGAPRRIVYAEGEDERVLRASQIVVDEGLAKPILLGRPQVIAQAAGGLACACGGQGVPARQPGVRPALPRLLERVPPDRGKKGRHALARIEMRRNTTLSHP